MTKDVGFMLNYFTYFRVFDWFVLLLWVVIQLLGEFLFCFGFRFACLGLVYRYFGGFDLIGLMFVRLI